MIDGILGIDRWWIRFVRYVVEYLLDDDEYTSMNRRVYTDLRLVYNPSRSWSLIRTYVITPRINMGMLVVVVLLLLIITRCNYFHQVYASSSPSSSSSFSSGSGGTCSMSEDGYYSVGASICFIIACAATARMDTKHHRHRHGSSSSSSVMELEHNTDNNSCSRGEVSLYSLLRKEKNEPYTIEQQDEVAEQQRHKYYQHRHHTEVFNTRLSTHISWAGTTNYNVW